jgi:dimethylhistidine N-methyltransferase
MTMTSTASAVDRDPVSSADVDVALHDCEPDTATFYAEVIAGLTAPRKTLPCKYFYDSLGSKLFDQICDLDEYYPTRTELGIMQDRIGEMADALGDECRLVEYGSGSSTKTRLLLDHAAGVKIYVPVDISRSHLLQAARGLSCDYPRLTVMPVCADYTAPFTLPPLPEPVRSTAVFFPGSTIGNFHPRQARAFLMQITQVVGRGGGLLIGVDLKKDPRVLHAAYNDSRGVTAAFNLNLLTRINKELAADFDLGAFRHEAFYDDSLGRVEMHLVSLADQPVHIGETRVVFRRGETIHTECSYKYSRADFEALAASAGYAVEEFWTDSAALFSVQYLRVR